MILVVCCLMPVAVAAETALVDRVTAGLKARSSAGWTGGSRAEVVTVQAAGSGPVALPSQVASKAEEPLEELVLTAFAIGYDIKDEIFASVASSVGIASREDGHSVKQIALKNHKTGEFKAFIARRFQDARDPDVILIDGKGDEAYVFLVSLDGMLRKAAFKKHLVPARKLGKKDAKRRLSKEMVYWRGWLKTFKAFNKKSL